VITHRELSVRDHALLVVIAYQTGLTADDVNR
jgi:hypothetical protein